MIQHLVLFWKAQQENPREGERTNRGTGVSWCLSKFAYEELKALCVCISFFRVTVLPPLLYCCLHSTLNLTLYSLFRYTNRACDRTKS